MEKTKTVLDVEKNNIEKKNKKIVNLTAIVVDVLHETINDDNITYTNCVLKFLTGKPKNKYIIGFVKSHTYNLIEKDTLVTVEIKYNSEKVEHVKFFNRYKKIPFFEKRLINETQLIELYK